MENLVSAVKTNQNEGEDQVLVVSSVQVAKHLDKQHFHVMRGIREILAALDTPDEESGEMPPQIYVDHLKASIIASEYVDERGKKQECFLMTEDGFYSLIRTYRNKEAKRLYQTLTGEFFAAKKELKRLKEQKIAEMKKELADWHYKSEDGTYQTMIALCEKNEQEVKEARRQLFEYESNPIKKYSREVQDITFRKAEDKARALYAPALREVYKEMMAVYDIAQEFADYISEVGSKPQDEWVDKPSGHLRRRAGQLTNRRLKCDLRASVGPDGLAEGLKRWLQEPCDIAVAE